MRLISFMAIFCLLTSCAIVKTLNPSEIVYQIVLDKKDNTYKPCYFNSIQDLDLGVNVKCVEWKDVADRLVLHPDKLKALLTAGLDDLIAIKNQNKPK